MFGQGNIPDDWEGEYCKFAVCWPNSPQWLAVLRGVLTLPARGRFWDGHTGSILEAQSIIRETFDSNLHLEESLMSCNDSSIGEALAQIAIALAAQTANGCCERQGSGGAPTVAPPFNPIIPGNPDIDPPPTGFETWEEFNAQKCSIAWNIVETLETDLGNMTFQVFGGFSVSALAALLAIAFATPIPFDDIIAIAGLLLSVEAVVIITTTLSLVNDNEEDLVCELYNGQSSSDSRTMYLAKFAELVSSGVANPVEAFAVNSLMAYMLGSAVTNRLYEKDLTKIWAARDCDDCQSEWTFSMLPSGQDSGTLVSGSMAADSTLFVAAAVLEIGPSDPCPGDYLLVVNSPPGGAISSITLATGGLAPSACGVDWQWIETSTGSLWNTNNGTYEFDTFIAGRAFNYFAARSTVPFSLEFNITI
jgi:hypothetical protein